jgi:hypothetical protein
MFKIIIAIIVVIVIGLLVWFFCFPPAQVVRLIECAGAANDEPDLEEDPKEVFVRWNHIFGAKVKFKNDSKFDGARISITCTDFFNNPASELDFTLAIGESKTLELRKDIPDNQVCEYILDPYCKTPGPSLIKKP